MNEALVAALLKKSLEDSPVGTVKCVVTSLVIWEAFGGEVVASVSPKGESHFSNRILGTDYDFAPDHVPGPYPQLVESPELLEDVPSVAHSLANARENWLRTLRTRRSLPEISHIVIQDEEDNPGRYSNPDFSCVIVTADSVERLNASSFFPGQTFRLKRASGPIVAVGKLDRWIAGRRVEWSQQDIHSVTRGYPIANHKSFWQRLEQNSDRAFLIAWFTDTQSLELPIYPFLRSHGERVIAVPDAASELGWLHADGCTLRLPRKPPSLRDFRSGFQFHWETLLSPEVSAALTERMPPFGRFRERIAVVNGALSEYFSFLEALSEGEILGSFTEDQLTILSELVEEAPPDADPMTYVAEALAQLGQAYAYAAATSPNGAEMRQLSEILRQLKPEHVIFLSDQLRKRAATLEAHRPGRDRLDVPDSE